MIININMYIIMNIVICYGNIYYYIIHILVYPSRQKWR